MSNLFSLEGRTALVTGSSQGIGEVCAHALADAGATVLVHGRDEAKAQRVADAIASRTGRAAHSAVFDLTDPAAVARGMRDIEESYGVPDIVVNNAGIQRREPLESFSDEDWDLVIETNLSSAFRIARAVAAGMKARGSGRIINIGSVQSQLARPSITPYAAAKGGIVMLTKGLCAELAPHGVAVNALAPGYIATELTRSLVDDPEFSAWVRARTPAGRWGTTADLIGTLVFLASDASAFVNGQTIYVDGGMTAVV